MSLSKITKEETNYGKNPDNTVVIRSKQLNTVIDEVNLKSTSASPTFTGTVTLPDVVMSGHKDSQEFTANAFQYPNPGTDWTPALNGATLGASLSSKKVWLPLNFLKIGDEIVSYKVIGDITEADAVTLDCKLVTIDLADPITTNDVTDGGITQLDADGDFDSEAVLASVETVATDTMYVLEIEGTTGTADAITVMGAEVKVNRK